jgi:primosomal protein N' (replication factor Y)
MEQKDCSAFLLHGVTGSGKTEVYLKSVESCLEQQRQALVLVPEISLTPQLVARFRARFAVRGYRIAVLHSGLSAGERFDAWREIARGRRDIVVGARSAVFAPLQNPGLIVVDEEHDSSYKQSEGFRYNARDLALVRGRQQNCPVVLGSATPSLGSYFRSEKDGAMRRLSLPDRVHQGGLPQVELIDLRGTATAGALSNVLVEAIQNALENKEQVLLLLNRRGYAPFLICSDCGASFHCPNCSISLTFHQRNKQLRCHYCDYTEPVPETCHKCRSLNIETQGAGTERLEEELTELFPTAKIARMDRDSTLSKGSHQRIVNAVLERKIDILLGTQMVAKGHDFPGVALVGVINADGVLNLPDFRCSERGFSLLTQVAGRAGRLAGGGKVLIQTYNPEHYALQSAVNQDYRQFSQQELQFRRELSYPPYGYLVNLIFSGNSLALVQAATQEYMDFLAGLRSAVQVLGPSPCPLARLRGKHRYQILLKSEDRRNLREVLARLDEGRSRLPRQVTFQVDVDPIDML